MYLHLGSSVIIHQDDVLGIFDLDNTTSSHLTRDFLSRAEKQGRVISAGEDLPKSFLLCQDRQGNVTVYLSQLATSTLIKRLESDRFELM